jgi:hypothetical protein
VLLRACAFAIGLGEERRQAFRVFDADMWAVMDEGQASVLAERRHEKATNGTEEAGKLGSTGQEDDSGM